jgi:hypothetical protein
MSILATLIFRQFQSDYPENMKVYFRNIMLSENANIKKGIRISLNI